MNSGCSASKACASWVSGGGVDDVVPPDVAALGHRDSWPVRRTTSTCRTPGHFASASSTAGLSALGSPRRYPPSAVTTTSAPTSLMRDGERVGAEPAEDHAVRRPEPRAGEHRDDGLGDHRQVDRDPVAGADPELGQRVRGPADLALQVGVGDVAGVALGLADPVDRDPVAVARVDVAVHAVHRDVELAADEPLRVRRLPVEHLGPVLSPSAARGPGAPRTRAGRRPPRRGCRAGRSRPRRGLGGGAKVRVSVSRASSWASREVSDIGQGTPRGHVVGVTADPAPTRAGEQAREHPAAGK